jgi:hypothetical protein
MSARDGPTIGARLVEERPYIGPEGRGTLLVFEFEDQDGVKTIRLVVPEEEPDETGET